MKSYVSRVEVDGIWSQVTADTDEMDRRATATLHLYKRGPRTPDTVEKLRQNSGERTSPLVERTTV